MSRHLWWVDATGVTVEIADSSLGVTILDGPIGLDVPPREVTTAPRSDAGAVLVAQRHSARPINLPVFLDGTTHRQALEDFAHSLHLGAGQLIHVDDDGNERTLRNVIYDGGFEGDEADARTDWSRRVLNLVALDPYWYDEADTVVLGPAEADYDFSDGTVGFNQAAAFSGAAAGISAGAGFSDAGISFNAAGTAFSGGAIVTFNQLTSPLGVWPTFTIHGPATYVKVVHLRTGEVIETNGITVPPSQNLVIVTRPEDRNVLLNGAPAWDRVTAETSATMQLLPAQPGPLTDENGVQILDELGRPIVVEGDPDQIAVIFQGTDGESYIQIGFEERWLTP